MKAVIVVEPAFLREVEDGKVEIVVPNGSVSDILAMKKRLVSLLEDDEKDVMTISFPGSSRVQVVRADKVKNVLPA